MALGSPRLCLAARAPAAFATLALACLLAVGPVTAFSNTQSLTVYAAQTLEIKPYASVADLIKQLPCAKAYLWLNQDTDKVDMTKLLPGILYKPTTLEVALGSGDAASKPDQWLQRDLNKVPNCPVEKVMVWESERNSKFVPVAGLGVKDALVVKMDLSHGKLQDMVSFYKRAASPAAPLVVFVVKPASKPADKPHGGLRKRDVAAKAGTTATPTPLPSAGDFDSRPLFSRFYFFSDGLFMGLSASLVFLLIAFWGFGWLSSVQTMSRFEAPKKAKTT